MMNEKKLLRIGVLIIPTDPFWVQISQFIAEELGPRQILLNYEENFSRNMNKEDLADLMDELLALELDAFICLNLPTDFMLQLVRSGIQVICLDEAFTSYPGFTAMASWEMAGRMIGEFLAEQMHGHGHLLCVIGEEGPLNYNANRLSGLSKALAPYPDMTMETIQVSWNYELAMQDLEKHWGNITRQPDGYLGLSDSLALAAREVARKHSVLEKDTIIAGINGDPLALAAIAEGSMAATVHVMTKDLSRRVVDIAILAAEGQPVPESIHVDAQLVTQENVNQVAIHKLMDIAMMPSKLVGYNRQAEQSRLKQLEISLTAIQRMGAHLDRRQLLEEIADLILANYEFNEVYYYHWSLDAQLFTLEMMKPGNQGSQEIPKCSAGLLAEVVYQNRPIYILDALGSRRYPIDANCPGIQSRCLFPVSYGATVLGVLDLRGWNPIRVRRLDLIGLHMLAQQMGIALRNAELYAEAVEARSAAEAADQLKTRLLANVSHELRAPLNVILGYTRVALNHPNPYNEKLPEQLEKDLERVFTSGEHLIRLINDLLDLSRAEIGALELFPETIAPREFFEEVFHSMAGSAGASTNLVWELALPKQLPALQADPVRLRQVVINLLANAQKFTASGKITLGAEASPPYFHFWVQDTGPGIPYEQQELIFQPFVSIERSKARPEGIGLGLSVTRRLVDLHGGVISLDSKPGKGSTFHVRLPLPSFSGEPPVSQPLHNDLLFFSKSEAISGQVNELCQRMNWRIYRIPTGVAPEQIAADTQPAAIFWDMDRWAHEDWEFLQKLFMHPKIAQLPLLVYGLEKALPGDISAGVTEILHKPFYGQKLVDTINALCPPAKASSILIVDDETQSRLIYQQLIRKALPGVDVSEAEDGRVALKMLETQMPNLVLLDLVMPGLDGFTTLERIRTNPATRNLPVMIITGKNLTREDIDRLDYGRVMIQNKQLLTQSEIEERLRSVFNRDDMLPQPTSRAVKLTIGTIHQSYQMPISRHQLAEAVGVTESYLSKIFHDEIGISPWEYLTRIRVNQAKSLLRDTDAPVAWVASKVGFEDPAYFSRVFRKLTGVSPQTWRKK